MYPNDLGALKSKAFLLNTHWSVRNKISPRRLSQGVLLRSHSQWRTLHVSAGGLNAVVGGGDTESMNTWSPLTQITALRGIKL